MHVHRATNLNSPEHADDQCREVPIETVWKIAEGTLDRVCSMAQHCEMGLPHPLLPTDGAPNWGLSRFSKQYLQLDFSY
jgi:hypothetical protein